MEKLILVTIFFVLFLMSGAVSAKSANFPLEFIAKATLNEGHGFKGSVIGGLAGVVYDSEKDQWILVSGDRGHAQEPRFFDFKFKVTQKKNKWRLEARPLRVTFVHEKGQPGLPEGPLSIKGIAWSPWRSLLISNEGTGNLKQRATPVLMDIKREGVWVRDFELPEEFQPEPVGRQTKGVQNNRGPEGLTSNGDGSRVWVAIESPLLQDQEKSPDLVKIVQYEMPEAWIIKPVKTYIYPLGESSQGAILSERGVSELLWLHDTDVLVMERAFEVSMKRFGYSVKLFETDLSGNEIPLKKKLVFDFKSLGVRVPNFEGLAPGPVLPDGRKTLLVVSNNNFKKGEKTEFWLFAWKAD